MTNANYGQWNDPDGEDAAPKGPVWTLKAPHDAEEDAILARVDAERGYPLLNRMRATSQGMKGVEIEVEPHATLQGQLERFVERLVQIMIHAPANGGGSATRAYVIAREMQILLRDGRTYKHMVSPDGARALATELDAYLPSLEQREGETFVQWVSRKEACASLAELRDRVHDALSTRKKTRRGR